MADLKPQILQQIKSYFQILQADQNKNGSFPLELRAEDSKGYGFIKSPFATSLILNCLSTIKKIDSRYSKIAQKGVNFLYHQQGACASLNYIERADKGNVSYPDDLDDTFCAWSAIAQHNKKLIDGTVLAKLVSLLTHLEVDEGGPYYTWVIEREEIKDKWRDIDPVVNSNIGFFLQIFGIDLPNLTNYLKKIIRKGKLSSFYYTNHLTQFYFISRFCTDISIRAEIRDTVLDLIKSKLTVLETAFALSALINTGYRGDEIEALAQRLLLMKTSFGKFCPIWLDRGSKESKIYAGSSALTLAFCLESLSLYLSTLGVGSGHSKPSELESVQSEIVSLAKASCQKLNKVFRGQISSFIDLLVSKDKNFEITLIPYLFDRGCINGRKKLRQKTASLCVANLFGWIAYTIYDDFLDNEGDPKLLPIANFCQRQLCEIYNRFNAFDLINDSLNKIDQANFLETKNRLSIINNKIETLKIPKLSAIILAEKSIGCALGPLFLASNETDRESIKEFFTYYLSTKQINDDAHDWENDLRASNITFVLSCLLQSFVKSNGGNQEIDLTGDLDQLQMFFWQETMPKLEKIIKKNCRKAKLALANIEILKDKTYFANLIDDQIRVLENTMFERNQAVEFLNTFKG